MSVSIVAVPDVIRSIAFGSITNAYQTLGTPSSQAIRMFRLINPTDGDMLFSIDGTNDNFYVPANSFVLYDLTANREKNGELFVFPNKTQFFVKYATAPSKNGVYLEIIYARGQ
jgi:hypothetical protein